MSILYVNKFIDILEKFGVKVKMFAVSMFASDAKMY